MGRIQRQYVEARALASDRIRSLVADGPLSLPEVVGDLTEVFDAGLVREALVMVLYRGEVVLTEDRNLVPGTGAAPFLPGADGPRTVPGSTAA